MMKDVGDTMGYWQKDPVSLVEICSWMKMGYFLKSSRTCWLTELPQHFDIRRSWAQALLSAVWAVDADFFLGVRAPSGLDLGFAAVSVAAVRGSSFFHWLRGQKDKKWHSLCPWQETLSTLLVMHGLGANGSPLFCHIFCLLGCCTYYNTQYIIYMYACHSDLSNVNLNIETAENKLRCVRPSPSPPKISWFHPSFNKFLLVHPNVFMAMSIQNMIVKHHCGPGCPIIAKWIQTANNQTVLPGIGNNIYIYRYI
jgi:hypothetical protein